MAKKQQNNNSNNNNSSNSNNGNNFFNNNPLMIFVIFSIVTIFAFKAIFPEDQVGERATGPQRYRGHTGRHEVDAKRRCHHSGIRRQTQERVRSLRGSL